MHYQTRLLPLDEAGGFLLAIIHDEQKFGGEDTRETQYARLAIGHVDAPGRLHDLAAVAFPKRHASPGAVKHQTLMAQGQDEVAAGCKPGSPLIDQYRMNARSLRHAAHLGVTGSEHVNCSDNGVRAR